MKKFFILSCILCTLTLNAQTFHTIVFSDTHDQSVGNAAKASHDYYTMNLIASIETALGMSYVSAPQIDMAGYDCNRNNLTKVLNNLSCGPEDVVVFIYLGHGSRGMNDWSNFPQMCLAVPKGAQYRNEDDYYHLENVRNVIMKKNPRFCLVIGDCCNSYSPTLSTKEQYAMMDMTAKDTRGGENAIKKLFLSKKGSVILTASVKGQYGWCINSGYSMGMFLEKNLNEVFQEIVDGKTYYSSWENLLSTVRTRTYNYSKTRDCIYHGERYTQTPYYEIALKDAPKVDNHKPKATTLKQALIEVADWRNTSGAERIAKSRTVRSKYFSGQGAKVEVVGKDGKTVILSTNIDKYLLRIATEEDLANISIIEEKKSEDNKLTYLKVHEIYLASDEEDIDFE